MSISERIKKLAVKSGLTLKQLATEIGMSEPGFHSMLKNNSVKVETLEKLTKVFDVSINVFFDKDNSQEREKDLAYKKEILKLQKKIQEIEKTNIGLYETKVLESDVNKNARKGKGLIYLEWDVQDSCFITSYKELKEALTAEDYKKIMSTKDKL